MNAGNAGSRRGGEKREGDGSPAEWAELEAQMHELEVLLEATEVPPALLTVYWELSADLIAMLEEMGAIMLAVRSGVLDPAARRERYLGMRQRLLGLQARAQEISLDADALDSPENW
jgi:hypothetical protein